MEFSKDFLWGGWNEGGKGASTADVMTAGAHGVPRQITDGVIEGLNDWYKNVIATNGEEF